MAIKFLELALLLMLVIFVFTQIILPALDDRPIFPFLKREKKLSDELRAANQKLREQDIGKEVVKRKSKIKGDESA